MGMGLLLAHIPLIWAEGAKPSKQSETELKDTLRISVQGITQV